MNSRPLAPFQSSACSAFTTTKAALYSPRRPGLTLLWVPLRLEQPACLVHQFLLGPVAGIGEVAIRIAHHLLRTVIVVLDGDVDRHVRRLPHVLSVRRCPRCGNG